MDQYSVAFCLPFPAEIQLDTSLTYPIDWYTHFGDLWQNHVAFGSDSSTAKMIDRCYDVIESVFFRFNATSITITQLSEINQAGFVVNFPYAARADAFIFDLIRKYPFVCESYKWFDRFSKDVLIDHWIHVVIPIPDQYSVLLSYDHEDTPRSFLKIIENEMKYVKSKYKLQIIQQCYDLVNACIQNRVARLTIDETDRLSTHICFHFHFFTKTDHEKMLAFLKKHNYFFALEESST